MDAEEFSKSISKHLMHVTKGTQLEKTVKVEHKAKLKQQAPVKLASAAKTGAAKPKADEAKLWAQGQHEYVEIDHNLFFFYNPSTIVRWPKPVEGELKNFTVRIVTPAQLTARIQKLHENPDQNKQKLLTHDDIEDFEGRFLIESTELTKAGNKEKLVTLMIAQQNKPGEGIDIVVLGNPGGELGANSSCKG